MNNVINYGIATMPGAPLGLPIGIPTQSLVKRTPSLPPPEIPGQNLKRALTYLADYGGCGFYRCMGPDFLLNLQQKAVIVESTAMILDPRFYNTVETVKFQRQATVYQKDFIKALKTLSEKEKPLKLMYEVDDVVFAEDIPHYNRNRSAFTSSEIQDSIKEILHMMDEITVTTDYFRDYIINKTGIKNVTTVPNYLMKWWFDRYYNMNNLIKQYDKNKKKPIIAIFASGTHVDVANLANQQDDFEMLIQHFIKTRTEFQWHFYGCYPLPLKPYIDRGEMKTFKWSSLGDFAEIMANSGAQLTFAALRDNEFNKCKSNIKLIESGAIGLPCVCPNLVTYKDAFLKYSNGNEFIDCIKTVLKNQTTYVDACKKSRAFSEKFWLDDDHNLMKHHEAYFTSCGSNQRKYIKNIN
jgi:hypothetical protein